MGSEYTVDEKNLAALVERVLGGETRAYEAVFLATKDSMYFHAKTILQSEEAAWDAVQDAYIAAFRSLEKLKTPSTADIWLCAIAANICFSRLKKRAAAQGVKSDEAAGEGPGLDCASARADIERFVGRKLETMPDMERTAVLLRYCDDMSLSQIGSIMRCGEAMVEGSLDSAEKRLCVCRDTASASGITPTELKNALVDLQSDTVLSPSITLSIGSTIAQRCGYESGLRVTTGYDARTPRGTQRRPEKETRDAGEMRKAPDEEGRAPYRKAPPAEAPAAEKRRTYEPRKTNPTLLFAAALVIIGLVVGAFALRGLLSGDGSGLGGLMHRGEAEVIYGADAPAAEKRQISSECAQAYMGVITDYTGRFGVCTSQTAGQGLAYAQLLDFDGDGLDELYLYYIQPSGKDAEGGDLYSLTEELWDWADGALSNCFTQTYYAADDLKPETGAERWSYNDGGIQRLASWYSYVDENGYVDQVLRLYAISGGELAVREETTAMFVVANAANQRRDGYLIEQYYGSENSHYDDIGYFVEGAVTDAEGRRSYNYEKCQAILDIGTTDIVPLDNWDEDSPVAKLKDFYDMKKSGSGAQLIYPKGLNGDGVLAWEISDINGFLSRLADICTGNAAQNT